MTQRTFGETWRRILSATGAGFVAVAVYSCGSAEQVPRMDEGSGGAMASGGAAAVTGGVASASGGASPGSGGSLAGSGGTTPSSGGAPPSGGSGVTGGAASDVPDAGTHDPDVSVPRPQATGLSLPTTMDDPKVAPWFKVYRPADLAGAVATTGRALPVIAWANGGCFRVAAAWQVLYERWAAGGFIVLALDAAPDGNALLQTTVDHQIQLVDWAVAEAGKPGSPYAGKLDTTRIVAAGNSCGGVTALGVAARDDRIQSVFVLSGSSTLASTNKQIMAAIDAPVGYIVGGTQDIAAPNATADYGAMAPGVPGMIVQRASGDHVLVSTDAAILAQVAVIGLDWMDLSLYGTPAAYAALTSRTVCTGCDPGLWTLKAKHLESLRR